MKWIWKYEMDMENLYGEFGKIVYLSRASGARFLFAKNVFWGCSRMWILIGVFLRAGSEIPDYLIKQKSPQAAINSPWNFLSRVE